MKKILIIIFVIFLAFIPAACDNKDDTDEKDTVLLLGFDNYREVQSSVCTWGNLWGRAEINTDKKYIKQGDGSLHVLPAGDYASTNAYPFFMIGCDRPDFATNVFSDFDNITLDVYNDMNKDLTIKMHIGVYGSSGLLEDTPIITYTLKANSWNKVVYDLSDGSIKKAFNNLEDVFQIFLQFPEYKRSKDDIVNSLYVDNMRAKVNSNPKPFNKKFAKDEILYFENKADINFIDARAYEMNIIFNAELSINDTEFEYISQGSGSLKCEFKKIFIEMDSPFIFTPQFWIPIHIYTTNFQTQLAGATGVSFDIFNANSTTQSVKIFYESGTTVISETISLNPESMQTVEIIPPDMENFDAFGIMHYSDAGATYYIDNIKAIKN